MHTINQFSRIFHFRIQKGSSYLRILEIQFSLSSHVLIPIFQEHSFLYSNSKYSFVKCLYFRDCEIYIWGVCKVQLTLTSKIPFSHLRSLNSVKKKVLSSDVSGFLEGPRYHLYCLSL